MAVESGLQVVARVAARAFRVDPMSLAGLILHNMLITNDNVDRTTGWPRPAGCHRRPGGTKQELHRSFQNPVGKHGNNIMKYNRKNR